MPNPNWKKSQQREVFLARNDKGIPKVETEGIHVKCKKCPIFETCENVLYKAKGRGKFYCGDNPREKKKNEEI